MTEQRYIPKNPSCIVVSRQNGRVTLQYPTGGPFEVSDLDFQTQYEPVRVPEAPKPTVGRVVHYHSYGTPGGEFKPEARAATITAVNDNGTVDVCVLNPTGFFFNRGVKFADTPTAGCVTWPPRT